MEYLMEDENEILRLEKKTDLKMLREQACWAGLQPGMRVADIGCGPGLTTNALFDLAQPGGTAVGVDLSAERIVHARRKYIAEGLVFEKRDALLSMDDIGQFDFVWARFLLEYYRTRAAEIVQNLSAITKPGGILCLVDLDRNCLNHYDMPERLDSAVQGIIRKIEEDFDFDSRVGIRLYSFLHDLGFDQIGVTLMPHHLIYGGLNEADGFNWTQKVVIAGRRSGYPFTEYTRGFEEFAEEFRTFFFDARRFTYTPLIACRGRKPLQQ